MKYTTRQEGEMLRIIADMDFLNSATGIAIRKGELGGLIGKGSSLSQEGTCWIDEDTVLTESCVLGDAYIQESSLEKVSVNGCTYIAKSNVAGAGIDNSYLWNVEMREDLIGGLSEIYNSVLKFTNIEDATRMVNCVFANTLIKFGRAYKDVICNRIIGLSSDCYASEGIFLSENYLAQGYEGENGVSGFDIGCVKGDSQGRIVQKCNLDTWNGIHETKTNGELSVFALPLFVRTGKEVSCPFEYGYGVNEDKFYVEVRGEGKTLFFEGGETGDIGFICVDNLTYSEISIWDIFENDIATGLLAEMYAFGNSLLNMTITSHINDNDLQTLREGVEAVFSNAPIEEKLKDDFNDISLRVLGEIAKRTRTIVPLAQMNLPKSITPIVGSFEMVSTKPQNLEMAEDLASDMAELKEKFRLFPEREYTEAERRLIPSIPSYIKLDALTLEVANLVKKSFARPPHLRKTNLLFEGPKGTGKTQRVTTLAGLWGVPRVSLCCSSNMTEDTLVGGILPYLPETTLDEQLDAAVSFYETKEGMERPEFVFVASQLALALEHGWVCEIQEPTCINDAGVLIALNSILEKDGQLQLPNRIIKRHPDAIVVITTNRDYEGCRPLNQALRDRMDWSVAAELPEEDDLTERVMSYTGCTDENLVKTAVRAVEVLNEQLAIMGINNSVSQRGLNNFIADLMDGIPVKSCVDGCLLNSITTDPEELAELKTTLTNSTNIYTL